MILCIPSGLSPEAVREIRADLEQAQWTDGRVTAGYQSAQAKRNDQVAEGDPIGLRAGQRIVSALERNPTFIAAALPLKLFPPLFNRYAAGQAFGPHVDNAIRQTTGSSLTVRTDLSATLFLSGPDEYAGGQLVIDAPTGTQSVKLAAGDMVLYPATSIHHVTEITEGTRVASFFWIQSMVREETRRSILFELDTGIRAIRDVTPDHPALVRLVNVYHNLVRSWAEC